MIDRCPAAHDEDPSPCEGPADAVRITDQARGETLACIHHGAVLLASLEGGQVHPGPRMFTGEGDVPPGAAIEIHKRAQQLKPFDFNRAERGSRLPTREQMMTNAAELLDQAYKALSDAADELRSDWRPVGSSLTDEQAEKRRRYRAAIEAAKQAINEAKR